HVRRQCPSSLMVGFLATALSLKHRAIVEYRYFRMLFHNQGWKRRLITTPIVRRRSCENLCTTWRSVWTDISQDRKDSLMHLPSKATISKLLRNVFLTPFLPISVRILASTN